jgi:REP element-mobilizing transposase RayT
MDEPVAYFFTWGTYGAWLPGDSRGWTEYRHGWKLPDPIRRLEAIAKMTEDACRLDARERKAVEEQLAETCQFRGWDLHAANCRSNHVHVVLSGASPPKVIRGQLKAWCTRKLKSLELAEKPADLVRENWWAERGSQRHIYDEKSLEAAIVYVRDGQDTGGSRS